MEKIKPQYLGKVLPSDDKNQMTKFLDKKYNAFNKVYDACKDESSNISDISNVSDDDSNDLKIKVKTSSDTLSVIKEKVSSDPNTHVENDVIKVTYTEEDIE